MSDRHDVHPHHLLRALLDDRVVRDLVSELGADPDEVRVTLDRAWLGAADTIDPEEIAAVGIDLATVLAAVNPPFDEAPDWGGRRLTDPTRELLVRALGVRAATHGSRVGSAHLLLSLLSSKDRILVATFRAHGLTARAARPVVERWTRRAP